MVKRILCSFSRALQAPWRCKHFSVSQHFEVYVHSVYYQEWAHTSIYSYIMFWFLYSWTFCPGRISRQQDIEFQLLLEPNVEPPVFTLTCVTTGGPPTTVTWTRDGTAIDYQSNSSFRFSRTVTDFIAATYNNTLTVTGNFPGRYSISAQNRNTVQYDLNSFATSILQVNGKYLYISVHKLHCLWFTTLLHKSGAMPLEMPPVANIPNTIQVGKICEAIVENIYFSSNLKCSGYGIIFMKVISWAGVCMYMTQPVH